MIQIFKKIEEDFNNKFVNNYTGEVDPMKVLDMSHLKDDLDGLIEEMVKQPSIHAFWANLKRIAEDNYNKYSKQLELYQASKNKAILEDLKSQGVKLPTAKMIEREFYNSYATNEYCTKLTAAIDRWRNRRDILIVIEKGVVSRDNQLKALSYLMGQMINANFEFPKLKPKIKNPKYIKE